MIHHSAHSEFLLLLIYRQQILHVFRWLRFHFHLKTVLINYHYELQIEGLASNYKMYLVEIYYRCREIALYGPIAFNCST